MEILYRYSDLNLKKMILMTGFVVHGHIYLIYKHDIFFLNIYMHVCVGLFILYTVHTHILCTQKRWFWMWWIIWPHYWKWNLKQSYDQRLWETYNWKDSANLADQLLFLDLVANFLFLSLRCGPMMYTSTKGRNIPCVCQRRSLAATTVNHSTITALTWHEYRAE